MTEREWLDAAGKEAARQRLITEAEALLARTGFELYTLVVEQLRQQLVAGKVNPVLVKLMAETRSAMLRGLHLPERIAQTVTPEAPASGTPIREGGTFDFAAFAQLFLALAGSGGAGAGAAGADGTELALGAARPDG